MTGPVLTVENASKTFVAKRNVLGRPTRTVKAVDSVSLSLMKGETLALVGESGCGKSTLGRLMTRLIEPTSGTIVLDGEDITTANDRALQKIRRKIQMVFQDPFAALNPRMTVGQMVAEPLMLHDIVPASERKARVVSLLEAVGLGAQHADRYPHEFSGGQRQRVVIARALAADPMVLVCDEPVSALDVSIRSQILNLLAELQERLGLSYIFISHDLGVVKHIADRVAVMYLGRIVEIGRTEDVFSAPRHPYTRALISAIPVPSPNAARAHEPIEGDMPNPLDPPSGCHFHTRCPYMRDICRDKRPELLPSDAGHPSACHFRDELPSAADILPKPVAVVPRLEKLFTAFGTSGVEEALP